MIDKKYIISCSNILYFVEYNMNELDSKFIIEKVLLMGCNRTNNNSNTQGNSGRCRCECDCRCRCGCGSGNNENVGGATEIALMGPGCINGTGRCLRPNESVQGDSGMNNNWGCVNPNKGNCGCRK